MSTPDSLVASIVKQMPELTLRHIGDAVLKNARANAEIARKGRSILELSGDNTGRNKALVVAAGPSLHHFDTAKLIKASGYNDTIIATESAIAWCLKNEIVPDLVLTLDSHPHRIVRWLGDPNLTAELLDSDDYFTRQEMDPSFREHALQRNRELIDLVDRHAHRIKIAVSSSTSSAVVNRIEQAGFQTYWWNPTMDDYDVPGSITQQLYELNGKPCINAGGNVGSACWVFAHAVLEKSHVGLLGMDFGYYGDTPHTQSQYYPEVVALVGEERAHELYPRVYNPHTASEFFTDPAYWWYRQAFLEMAREAAETGVRTFNCTGGGTLFGDSIEFVHLNAFVEA